MVKYPKNRKQTPGYQRIKGVWEESMKDNAYFDISHADAAPDDDEDRQWLLNVRIGGIARMGSIDFNFRAREKRKEERLQRIERQRQRAKEYEEVEYF